MMRAYSLTRIPEYRFERQFQLRPRLRAAGYARQAAHAGGFQRKGGGSAVRLYPLPGCLPDHAGRACASIKAARIRCAARTGGICHGGSIARYAGGAGALCQGVWAELQRAARRRSRRIEKSDAGFSRALRQNPGAQSGEYEMEHTAASYVFDPRGRLRLYVLYGQRPESWLHDLRLLLKEKIST